MENINNWWDNLDISKKVQIASEWYHDQVREGYVNNVWELLSDEQKKETYNNYKNF